MNDIVWRLGLATQHSADRQQFTTYIEAFIVFARSVLHVLRNEVDNGGVFHCFEPEWKALDKEPLPTFFRRRRDIVLKDGVEATRPRAEYAIIATVNRLPGGR